MSDHRPFDHQRYRDLIAPFALHALDDDERLDVADHLLECDLCSRDVEEMFETASVVALSESEAPPAALWARISSGMNVDAPATSASAPVPSQPRASQTQPSVENQDRPLAPVVDLASRRRARPLVAALVGAAAATAMVIPITRAALAPSTPSMDVSQIAAAQEKTPGTKRIDLLSTDGVTRLGDVVVTADGRGYIRLDNPPKLPDDRTYQLWTVVDGKPVSAGLLGTEPKVAAFVISSNAAAVALSVERSTGAISPETGPIAVATL